MQKPDLILLDEPSNHMDIESIQWLEDLPINKAKAVNVISHDKTFVDNMTNFPMAWPARFSKTGEGAL